MSSSLAIVDLQLEEQDGISLMEDLHRVLPDACHHPDGARVASGAPSEAMRRELQRI